MKIAMIALALILIAGCSQHQPITAAERNAQIQATMRHLPTAPPSGWYRSAVVPPPTPTPKPTPQPTPPTKIACKDHGGHPEVVGFGGPSIAYEEGTTPPPQPPATSYIYQCKDGYDEYWDYRD